MITVDIDIEDAMRGLTDVEEKQLPFALALSMNDAAKDGLDAVEQEIVVSFDNPTRFTQKSFFVKRASKRKLSATIERKTRVAGRHYLEVQAAGGARPQTGLEKLLSRRLKYSGNIRSVIPARGARKTGHGNWSPGQRNQVLSAIQAQRDTRSNTTKASKARKPRRAGYFVPREGSKLSPGVYQRMAKNKVKKIVHFSEAAPRYQRRFEFEEAAVSRIRRTFPMHFQRRFAQAKATAR